MTSAAARASSARGPPAGPSRRWHQQRLLLAAQLALSAGASGPRPRRVQIAFHETPLVDRPSSRRLPREPRPRVTDAVIGGKENLRALDFAHRMLPLFKSAVSSSRSSCLNSTRQRMFISASSSKATLMNRNPPVSALPRRASPNSEGQFRLHSRLHGHQRKAGRSRPFSATSGSRRPPSTKWS